MISRQYEDQNHSNTLMTKYQNILQICDKMTQTIIAKRPNCNEILNEKHLWALAENEFDYENESVNSFDKNFYIYLILESKLKNFQFRFFKS